MGIALGSAVQIAPFVAPVLVLFSCVIGQTPMDLQSWRGAVAMTVIAAITASLVTNSGRSAWFLGALVVTVYVIFGMTLYLLPRRTQQSALRGHSKEETACPQPSAWFQQPRAF